jgi:hypothetical protein
MNMSVILNGLKSDPNSGYCLWLWMNPEVYERKVDTPDELLAHILDAAVPIKVAEDQFRRTTRDLPTRVAKCLEVGGGILENLLRTITNLSLKN